MSGFGNELKKLNMQFTASEVNSKKYGLNVRTRKYIQKIMNAMFGFGSKFKKL